MICFGSYLNLSLIADFGFSIPGYADLVVLLNSKLIVVLLYVCNGLFLVFQWKVPFTTVGGQRVR